MCHSLHGRLLFAWSPFGGDNTVVPGYSDMIDTDLLCTNINNVYLGCIIEHLMVCRDDNASTRQYCNHN